MGLRELLVSQPEPGTGQQETLGKLWGPEGCPSRGTWAFLPPFTSSTLDSKCSWSLSLLHRMRPAAVVSVRGSSSLFSALPSPPQHTESMATESKWSYSICYDNQGDVAYMSPYLHQFCLSCALCWALQKPNCPLCRSGMMAILS